MSDPYGAGPDEPPGRPPPPGGPGAPYQPYQPNPYGGDAHPPNPYQPNPYGGAPAGGTSTDGVSIAGFVLSLLCCTSVVGLILGIVGMSRTKNGRRSGRWAAIAAIIVGALGTLAFAGAVGFIVWFGTSTVTPGSADVAQCVNIDRDGTADATLWKKDCDEPHDGEIVAVDALSRAQVDAYEPSLAEAICLGVLDPDYQELALSDEYYLGIVIDGDARNPDVGDEFLCYLDSRGTDKLDGPLAG